MRPWASRRASQSLSESDATEGTEEATEAWASPAAATERHPQGRVGCARAACSALETREARKLSGGDWWAAFDSQARDQPRLSESDGAARRNRGVPRLGARFGSGAGERDRERAPRETAVEAAGLAKGAAAASLSGMEDADGVAAATAEATEEAAERPGQGLPMTLEMPCAMDSSSSASAESWAARRRRASTRDMAPGGERRGRWGVRDDKPPGPASTAQSTIKLTAPENETGTTSVQ